MSVFLKRTEIYIGSEILHRGEELATNIRLVIACEGQGSGGEHVSGMELTFGQVLTIIWALVYLA